MNENGVKNSEMKGGISGGYISTYNKDGVVGTVMGTVDEGGGIETYNKHGHNLVLIGQTTDGHGGIWVKDRYGEHPAYYGHRR